MLSCWAAEPARKYFAGDAWQTQRPSSCCCSTQRNLPPLTNRWFYEIESRAYMLSKTYSRLRRWRYSCQQVGNAQWAPIWCFWNYFPFRHVVDSLRRSCMLFAAHKGVSTPWKNSSSRLLASVLLMETKQGWSVADLITGALKQTFSQSVCAGQAISQLTPFYLFSWWFAAFYFVSWEEEFIRDLLVSALCCFLALYISMIPGTRLPWTSKTAYPGTYFRP